MTGKAILFDLDGTLIDSIGANRKIVKEILAKQGITITEDDFNQVNGRDQLSVLRWLKKEKGFKMSIWNLLKERRKAQARIDALVKPYPWTKDALERLQDHPMAVATSSRKSYMTKHLKSCGINDKFQVRVCANDIKHLKPAPDIFLKAAKRLGAEPRDCVVIEDAVNGIIAAKRAGMKSVALLTTTPKRYFTGEAQPDLIIKDLRSLTPAKIEKL